MQKSTYSNLIKPLTKIEKDLDRISRLQEKGCSINSLLQEVYIDLKNMGDYLKTAGDPNQEDFAKVNARYEDLLLKFETISQQINPQIDGKVLASNNTLPDLINKITGRYQAFWVLLEKVTTVLGIGMVAFTLLGVTYFLMAGHIPFLKLSGNLSSGMAAIMFLLGLITGLLVHELAHAVVLANNGIKIKRIGLLTGSVLGGFVEADEDTFLKADPEVHLRFNASSIGTNALLTLFFFIIGLLVSADIIIYFALGNLFFGFINSFPISPIDGGWVYEDWVELYIRNKLWQRIFLGARFVLLIIWVILFIRLVLIVN